MKEPCARCKKKLAELHPDAAAKVLRVLQHVNAPGKLPAGASVHIHTAHRPAAEQLAAYKAGRSKLKRGAHNFTPARAADLVFQVNGKWSWDMSLPWWLIGWWAEHEGLRWGGRWGTPAAERKVAPHSGTRLGWDSPHCELPNWARM